MNQQALIQLAEEWIPFNKLVGVRAVRVEKGDILFEIPFREELIGDPIKRAIHGGVISMLADTAGGMAVWSMLDEPRARVSTIDLRIDYLLPGKPENLRAHATIVRVGKTVGVTDIRLFHPSNETATIATGKGVYAIRTLKEHAASSGAAG